MADHKKTPDILGSLLSGDPEMKKPADLPVSRGPAPEVPASQHAGIPVDQNTIKTASQLAGIPVDQNTIKTASQYAGIPVDQNTIKTASQLAGIPVSQNTIKTASQLAGIPVDQNAVKPARKKKEPADPAPVPAKEQEEAPVDKVKATFYIATETVEALEEGWSRLRKLVPKDLRGQVSKSLMVELAIQMALEELQVKGIKSLLARKARKE